MPPRTNSSKISFLCGLVKCKCGSNMVTQGCKNRLGVQYYYLICSNKRNLGAKVCNNKMISVPKLEEIVLNDIKKYFNSKNITNKINKYIKNTEKYDTELLKKKELLENEIVKINIQINNLLNSIAEANNISFKYINDKIEELDKQKEQKSKELSELKVDSFYDSNLDLINYIKNIDKKLLSNDFEEKKKLCKVLIDKIVVDNENIDIHYKI